MKNVVNNLYMWKTFILSSQTLGPSRRAVAVAQRSEYFLTILC
jgi:hypothetical protein